MAIKSETNLVSLRNMEETAQDKEERMLALITKLIFVGVCSNRYPEAISVTE